MLPEVPQSHLDRCNGMPTIRLENAAKLYRNNDSHMAAVLNINLQIEQGEFIFFVGSRGAGKSTLLEMISGELPPDRGNVYLDHINLKKLNGRRRAKVLRSFGKVPQDSALIRTETVLWNLMPRESGWPLKKKLVDEPVLRKALGLVGMPGCEDRYPLEFSISECRRIELAKAILHSPPILLLDEITDRVDDDTIWDVFHLLRELNVRGTTILMATRARKFVNIMRKRVITLSDGKIIGDVRRGRYGDIV